MQLNILYEDNHCIAVFKPAGVLIQGDVTGDPTMLDQIKYYLKQKHNKPGKVFLGLVHRLDRNVSGIAIFGKTSKGASRLSEQFRDHSITKIYTALVIGKPKSESDVIVSYLRKDQATNRVSIFNEALAGTQRAELSYETINSNNKYSLLKVALKTGRSHQIRAQLSSIGCPIVGDVKYGAPELLSKNELALCATSLTFVPPTGTEKVTLEIPVPESWPRLDRKPLG